MLFKTPYRISTITNNIDIFVDGSKKKIDVYILFDEIKLDNFIWSQCLKNGEKVFRGDPPKKKRNTGNKKIFDNQISFIYKIDENYFPNIKVFKNGNMQMTGARSIEDIMIPLDAMKQEISRIYKINPDILPDAEDIDTLELTNLKIRMINSDFKIFDDVNMTNNFTIKQKELHKILTEEYDMISRFDPSIYQGVKTEYWWNIYSDNRNGKEFLERRGEKNIDTSTIKKVTIAVFEAGKILITGATSYHQIEEAYNFIYNIIEKHVERISMLNQLKLSLKKSLKKSESV